MIILSYSWGRKVAAQSALGAMGRKEAGVRAAAAVLPLFLLALFPAAASAREQSAAIFDFELTDTSRDNQLAPTDAEHRARLALITERLRTRLAQSGRFSVLDISAVAKEAQGSNLQACGGCDVKLA